MSDPSPFFFAPIFWVVFIAFCILGCACSAAGKKRNTPEVETVVTVVQSPPSYSAPPYAVPPRGVMMGLEIGTVVPVER